MALRGWRAGLALGAALSAAGCVARPQFAGPVLAFPAPAGGSVTNAPVPAVFPAMALQRRTALLERLDNSSQGGLQPAVDVAEAAIRDASGATQATPVVRIVFPEQVLFDFDRDTLWPDAAPVCDIVADSIRRDVPGVQVTIVGHTDAIGGDAYNLDLSRRRALNVMRALLARGVDPLALSTVAMGKRQPVASDATPEGRAANRRVEFLVSPTLQANLAVVRQQPAAAGDAVEVLRPAFAPSATAAPDGLTLALVGSITLDAPSAPEQAAPLAEPAVVVAPAKLPPVARAAPLLNSPPAVPRTLAPEYAPRAPGDPLSY